MSSITSKALRRLRRGYGLKVMRRKSWTLSPTAFALYWLRNKTRPHALLPGEPVDTLWAHITVTSVYDGKRRKTMKEIARELHNIGVSRFGSGISYNFLIHHETGEVALGQNLEAKGTHTVNDKGIKGYSYDQNAVSLAVAIVGMPGCKLSETAKHSFAKIIAGLQDVSALTDGFDFNPHSLVAYKECPTDNVRNEMPAIRELSKLHRRRANK